MTRKCLGVCPLGMGSWDLLLADLYGLYFFEGLVESVRGS
jgi:hypothetical protein